MNEVLTHPGKLWESAKSLFHVLKWETVTVNSLLSNYRIDLIEWVILNSKNKKSEIFKRAYEQFYFDDGRLQQCNVAGIA